LNNMLARAPAERTTTLFGDPGRAIRSDGTEF
jgi:hypothetical protein